MWREISVKRNTFPSHMQIKNNFTLSITTVPFCLVYGKYQLALWSCWRFYPVTTLALVSEDWHALQQQGAELHYTAQHSTAAGLPLQPTGHLHYTHTHAHTLVLYTSIIPTDTLLPLRPLEEHTGHSRDRLGEGKCLVGQLPKRGEKKKKWTKVCFFLQT